MRIGIIGSGNVGGTLGKRLAQGGHSVIFSSRSPGSDEMKQLVADAGATARADSVAATAAGSDLVILATPWPGTKAAIEAAGDWSGKLLIDATNPLKADLSGLEVGNTSSGGEQVAGWARGARVVKCFNTVGSNIMANPQFVGGAAVLFYCGDDEDAKRTVGQLATELGFDARDAGPLTQARVLEPMALLWVSLAFTRGYGREFAFQILNR